jgi:hypothetical protein|nr:hypothetical protein [Candidatus Krumholzibacteria bacterium]
MKKLLILALSLVALALPTLSSACHVTEVTGEADCLGWNLCTTIYFTESADNGSLAYSVTILDGDGIEVTSFGETVMVSHEPGAGDYEFCFEGIWEGEYQVANATVQLTSSLDGGAPTVFTFDLDCSVSSERVVLGALKAHYR